MQRQYVTSSNVRSVGWENNTLEVEFNNGSIYHYHNVSLSEYQSVLVGSVGSNIHRLAKIHSYSRIA
ncbi:TPA: KTSC domain-containing protein [Streptococcus suis]|uniref:KTSC domain-containing protein n=1 Tax=Streptococcus suis TaxID=1307 RepID=A0AB37GA71_STRSU|nr:KTSC domain-containing protein [Streptococcus suis]MCB2913682.1 KTSC domain-containing protein [Streptococcus suis]MCB2919500.1 KTSC domain-containing protein [Streptococcus suis]MCQ8268955.1 KTSC domain-containing protein [Streptococcus suis]MDS1159996.1 KTSC domain-containing protein [Streptococcus suis]MDS1161593.1 KTSC domain-containing protein [Streptococcus suis]